MISLIILIWIASALNAPTWVLILGGVGAFFKLVSSFIKMCWEVYRWQDK